MAAASDALAAALPQPAPTRRRLSFRGKLAGMAMLLAVAAGYRGLADWRDTHGVFINMSDSLPNWAFLLKTHQFPTERGQYVMFDPPRSALLERHFGEDPGAFGKIVYGLPGDVVTREGAIVSVNGKPVGRLKPRTRLGEALTPGPTGRVPEGCLYVGTPHLDGFDSRYAEIGFVCMARIVGIGSPLL